MATKQNTIMSQDRVAGLDMLRGFAIVLVLLYHCTPNSDPNLGLTSILFKVATIGWFGVDLFFVLSGYLVCNMLLKLKSSGGAIGVFFWNRFMRIMPVYYLVLLFVLLIYPLATHQNVPSFEVTYPFWFYYSNNILGLNTSFYLENIDLGHFWSLAVEVQFYLLIPLLVWNLSREKLITILSITWLLVIGWRWIAIYNGVSPEITFGFSQYRCDGLILGALAAAHKGRFPKPAVLSFFALLSACYMCWVIWASLGSAIFKATPKFYYHRALLPIAVNLVSLYALIMALQNKSIFSFVKIPGLTFLAKYSYGIYIYHFLFNRYLQSILMPWLNALDFSQNYAAFIFFVIQLVLSTSVAWISFHYFESYFLNKKIRLTKLQ